LNRRHIRKLPYYAGSALSLARALEPTSLPRLLRKGRRDLVLRSGLRLEVHELLDILVLKETVLDDPYAVGLLPADTRLIVDVGAGIGDFTVLAASRFPRSSVLACEPNPEAFDALERESDRTGSRTSTHGASRWAPRRPTSSSDRGGGRQRHRRTCRRAHASRRTGQGWTA
jgi:hypothetical protein